jgi:hypothetical protein
MGNTALPPSSIGDQFATRDSVTEQSERSIYRVTTPSPPVGELS